MTKQRLERLVLDAVMIALYFVLSLFTLKLGNVHIGFKFLTLVVSATLFSAVDGCIIAACGELLNQLLSYGFTATTVLYLIPPMLYALTVGLVAGAFYRKKAVALERKPHFMYGACIAGGLLTTLGNTAVNFVDSKLYGYYSWAYVFGDFFVRLGTGAISAVVMATIAVPLLILVRPHVKIVAN